MNRRKVLVGLAATATATIAPAIPAIPAVDNPYLSSPLYFQLRDNIRKTHWFSAADSDGLAKRIADILYFGCVSVHLIEFAPTMKNFHFDLWHMHVEYAQAVIATVHGQDICRRCRVWRNPQALDEWRMPTVTTKRHNRFSDREFAHLTAKKLMEAPPPLTLS